MTAAGPSLSLDAFCAGLPDTSAAEARVAAAEMDRLARSGDALRGIERRYRPWALGAGGLFVLGLAGLFLGGFANRWLLLGCLGAAPGVAAHYAWRVLPRSRADARIEALNRAHFLPHGGLYFPPGERAAAVILVNWTPPPPELPLSQAPRDPRKSRDRDRPGMIW